VVFGTWLFNGKPPIIYPYLAFKWICIIYLFDLK